jgi:hypothetical protein
MLKLKHFVIKIAEIIKLFNSAQQEFSFLLGG